MKGKVMVDDYSLSLI